MFRNFDFFKLSKWSTLLRENQAEFIIWYHFFDSAQL